MTLYDFKAREEDELSFQKGTILYITDTDHYEHWCDAECDGKRGLVPEHYIPHKWYKSHMTRVEAENVLIGKPYNGIFLIRKSENPPTSFSLSIKVNNEVHTLCCYGHSPCLINIHVCILQSMVIALPPGTMQVMHDRAQDCYRKLVVSSLCTVRTL